MCNNQTDGKCIAEILKIIYVLQQNACPENCLESCDRPMLGGGGNCLICNTRPVTLYTCCGNGVPFSMPVCKGETTTCSNPETVVPSPECSSVFRIEKLDGNCATFRVLVENLDDCPCGMPFIGTNSFFTMDLSCVCAIRCLNDCYVECV